jgi:hypothetical protein
MKSFQSEVFFSMSNSKKMPNGLRPDKRKSENDRRQLDTYLADDRRSGIVNRRKRKSS